MKVIVGIILAAALIGGIWFLTADREPTPESAAQGSSFLTGSNQEPALDAREQTAVTVQIDDFFYSTSRLTVKSGTKVTWQNVGSIRHDVTPAEDSPKVISKSDLLGSGETYEFTFTEPGEYRYFCTPHPTQMRAIVEVVP